MTRCTPLGDDAEHWFFEPDAAAVECLALWQARRRVPLADSPLHSVTQRRHEPSYPAVPRST